MNIIRCNSPICDEDRAEHNFNGDLIIYQNITAMHELIAYADELLRDALDGVEPPEAQDHFTPDEFLKRTIKVQAHFRNSQAAKDIFFKALEQCGVNLNGTYYDHFPMRIVPCDKSYDGAQCGVIGHHRDSWGSNIHSQINWWAPLYQLEEDRTIAVYPNYWQSPIKNNTATWRHVDYLKMRKEAEKELEVSYPSAPSPQAKVDETGVIKVMLSPGDIVSFASTHLHASVPNTTKFTRYSVEMRTINAEDLVNNRTAPNVDNDAHTPMYQWFKHIITNKKLDFE